MKETRTPKINLYSKYMIKLKCNGEKIISIWDVPGKAVAGRNGGLLFYTVWLRQPH